MTAILLVLSLVAISAGAELLVRGASLLALRAGVSSLFVGLTIVGFGTSTPELGASMVATLQGALDVSVGNVVGSNIFNIAVILALTALVRPIRVQLAAVRRDLVIAIAAACVPWLGWLLGGAVPRWLGVALVASLLLYIAAAYRAARAASAVERALAAKETGSTLSVPAQRTWLDHALTNVLFVLAGLGLLVIGSRVFVESAIEIARAIGASDLIIGLTIVSAGTSLPELVTSLVAARRGNPDIAIGNVIGSNIFNAFGILGACAAVAPQRISAPVASIDTPVMLAATLALLPIMRSGGRISRGEGGVLLAGYAIYLGALIARG
jgi:cation:H+ antiporter